MRNYSIDNKVTPAQEKQVYQLNADSSMHYFACGFTITQENLKVIIDNHRAWFFKIKKDENKGDSEEVVIAFMTYTISSDMITIEELCINANFANTPGETYTLSKIGDLLIRRKSSIQTTNESAPLTIQVFPQTELKAKYFFDLGFENFEVAQMICLRRKVAFGNIY